VLCKSRREPFNVELVDLPAEFWKSFCHEANHPMAAVGTDHKFIWVNEAYELLTGYKSNELEVRTWMSITDPKDVGENLQHVQLLLEGKIDNYTTQKDYIHKKGFPVPVELTVRRYPVDAEHLLVCFRVEAPPTRVKKPELEQVKLDMFSKIEECQRQVAMFNANNNSFNKSGDYNSTKSIQYIVGGVVAMTLFGAWMFYYMALLNRPTINPTPPPGISNEHRNP